MQGAKRCHTRAVIFPVRRRANYLHYRTDDAKADDDAGQDTGPDVDDRDNGNLRRLSVRGRHGRIRRADLRPALLHRPRLGFTVLAPPVPRLLGCNYGLSCYPGRSDKTKKRTFSPNPFVAIAHPWHGCGYAPNQE